jgi:glycosyltransferase involved in cell wall biosynthesis
MVQAQSVELTILMPCLNEAETIAICVAKARNFLQSSKISGEVLIADNGSTDGSQQIASAGGARVVSVADRGYGAALQGGIAAARGRYIVMGDADNSYDFESLQPFVDALRAGAGLVMGNRFKGAIAPDAMPPLHRYLGNPVLSFLGRLFFRIPVGDFHCGLRGFNTQAIRELQLQATGMEFASEMIVRSALSGLVITEAPTKLAKDGRSRPPHLKTWRDGWRHLKFLLMYSPRWLFFVPGLIVLLIGILGILLLFASPLRVSNIVLDLNAFIVACFACVVGTQLIALGALSRHYAAMSGFLPWSKGAKMLDRILTTDRLSLWALGFILIGATTFGYATWSWAAKSFGELNDPSIPRTVVAGLTAFVIGLQILFAAFLVGVLRVPYARTQVTAVEYSES